MRSELRKFSLFIFLFCLSDSVQSCVDDDAKIAELAAANNLTDISACVDVLSGCRRQDKAGETLRRFCCETCKDDDPDAPSVDSELPGTDETVQLFLLSGQSECVGSARASQENGLDSDPETYPDLQGDIEGVWFAGYKSPALENRFFIAPMNAGNDKRHFGPEISFGERIYSVTGKRTMVMKYCVGGTVSC